jgi:hypothetical protein
MGLVKWRSTLPRCATQKFQVVPAKDAPSFKFAAVVSTSHTTAAQTVLVNLFIGSHVTRKLE